MIISNDLVINVESFLKCTLDCYLLKESRLCCDVLVLTEEEVTELIEAAFCDYIADYGIYIQRVYTKKANKEYLLIINIMALKSVIFIPNNFKKV